MRGFRFCSGLVVVGVAASAMVHAQSVGTEDHSAYFGAWTINRELSARPADRPEGRGREGGGRGRGGPPGGGFGGGRGGGGFGPPGAGPPSGRGGASFDPKEMEKTMALMEEVMSATPRWALVGGDNETIIFTDAEGRSSRFVPNDKKEKHQLTSGTIETRTRWDKAELRQEISLSGGMKAVRIFALTPESTQLTVTTTMDGGPGGRRPPLQLVYDRDE